MYRFLLLSLFLFPSIILSAQELEHQSFHISPELKENANAVIRDEVVEIEIEAIDKMIIRKKRMVTVLNESGQSYTRLGERYDDNTEIKEQKAIIYDEQGNRIKRIKSKEFRDQSLVGANLISDNRLKFYEYTPQAYPYTVVYESEVHTESTVFVNSWFPVRGYYLSVENSSYSVKSSGGIHLRFEEKNLDSLNIEKSHSPFELKYTLTNLPAYKKEVLSPDLENFVPQVMVAPNDFSLVGVQGSAKDWAEFGKWQYDHLLTGKGELSQETIEKITVLTADAEDDVEKIRRIYEFVQENTRYISVQLGIGGWEPMAAGEVEELGYGDCKALTNFTHALLDSQGITSYYTVVYGGREKVDIDADFASMQGNHVILNIPQEEEDLWLECTSQTDPLNFLGGFTDDRNVLVIKPEGGEIMKTKAYPASENHQESYSRIELNPNGGFSAKFSRKTSGVPYGDLYPLVRESEKDQELYYKKSWGHLKNLEIQELTLNNDKRKPEFSESLAFSGEKYASKAGNRILLPVHFFVPPTYNLPTNQKRNFPLDISRGRSYNETFDFILPKGFSLESVPEAVEIESKYGKFSSEIELKEEGDATIVSLERTYIINEGLWPADSYSDFRNFMNKVSSLSKQKAVLIETN